jgi:adenylate cyclase
MGGDFFGSPVNVAARLTGFARPGTVVVSEAAHDAAGVPLETSHIGKVRLHNVGSVRAFKVKAILPREAASGG